ncbi:MAG: hypothetical protein ACHQT6_02760 [Candidatus Acidiferrales bacterium]
MVEFRLLSHKVDRLQCGVGSTAPAALLVSGRGETVPGDYAATILFSAVSQLNPMICCFSVWHQDSLNVLDWILLELLAELFETSLLLELPQPLGELRIVEDFKRNYSSIALHHDISATLLGRDHDRQGRWVKAKLNDIFRKVKQLFTLFGNHLEDRIPLILLLSLESRICYVKK